MVRWQWWIGGAVGGLAVLSQAVVWQHARAMTTFVPAGQRTPPPEELSLADKLRTLVFGVTIPRPRATSTPADHGLGGHYVLLDGPVGPLSTLEVPGGPRTVVVVHGYAAEHSQLFATIHRLHGLGYTVAAPDLRGVGASDGHTTTLGFGEADDVAVVARYVGSTLGDPQPVLYGFSMGAAAIIGAAGRLGVPTSAVVAEASFDRLHTTVGHRFEAMGLPARGPADLLLFWGGLQSGLDPYRIAPVDDARGVGAPALVVGGTADARVRPEETRALAAAFPVGRAVLVEGFPHAELARSRPETWDQVVAPFLLEVAAP
ncbi:MAG: alpha/beta fold hydrolase [Myxococcota bacterium]